MSMAPLCPACEPAAALAVVFVRSFASRTYRTLIEGNLFLQYTAAVSTAAAVETSLCYCVRTATRISLVCVVSVQSAVLTLCCVLSSAATAAAAAAAADRVYSEVKRNARAALLRQIERERDGDMIDRSLLKNILDIFIEVSRVLPVVCCVPRCMAFCGYHCT